jgi:hypothetical protein
MLQRADVSFAAHRPDHEFSSLLRFSLRFNRSSLFLCIFAANCSYRSFSSLAARFSLMDWIRLCGLER